MKLLQIVSLGAVVLGGSPLVANEPRQDQDHQFQASLNGYEENPTLSTTGRGSFKGRLTIDGRVEYELTYAGLESDITQAHIHFGRPSINGGIAVWLCGTPTLPGPAGTPPCVLGREGVVTGTFTAANVIGPAGQGIAAGEFDELIAAIRTGSAYANVHTVTRPAGEIRGIIQ
jgi:CHRD domain